VEIVNKILIAYEASGFVSRQTQVRNWAFILNARASK